MTCRRPAKKGSQWCADHQDPSTRIASAAPAAAAPAKGMSFRNDPTEEIADGHDLAPAQPVFAECDEPGPEHTPESREVTIPAGLPTRQTQMLALAATMEAGHTPFLTGPSGVGKTAMLKQWADARGCDWVYLNASRLTDADLTGATMGLVEDDGTPRTVTGMPDWTARLHEAWEKEQNGEEYDQPMVVFDELTNAPPDVANVLMGVVNRDGYQDTQAAIGRGWKIPSNTIFAATGNLVEHSHGTFELTGPMEARLVHFPIAGPRMKTAKDVWFRLWGEEPEGDPKETFFDWDEGAEALRSVMTPIRQRSEEDHRAKKCEWAVTLDAFASAHPEYDLSVEAEAQMAKGEEPSGRLPSIRTGKTLCEALAHVPESTAATRSTQRHLMTGIWGEAAGRALQIFADNRDLPSAADWLDNPDKAHGFHNVSFEQLQSDGAKAVVHGPRPDMMKITARRVMNEALRGAPPRGQKATQAYRDKQRLKALDVFTRMVGENGEGAGMLVSEVRATMEGVGSIRGDYANRVLERAQAAGFIEMSNSLAALKRQDQRESAAR